MTVIIYTCTFLDYDQVFSPAAPTPGAEFVLISDRRPRWTRGWRWRPLPEAAAGMSQGMANRYCKFFPHLLFPDSELSVYLDGNTLVRSDLTPLIDEFRASGAVIGLFDHPQRDDLAAEADRCFDIGKIDAAEHAKARAQIAAYEEEGLGAYRLSENSVIFRRHDKARLAPMMNMWWDHISRYSRRDQISLPYVLWKTDAPTHRWTFTFRRENPYFRRYPHRGARASDLETFLRMKGMSPGLVAGLCGRAAAALKPVFDIRRRILKRRAHRNSGDPDGPSRRSGGE